jgi:hypothetical protein
MTWFPNNNTPRDKATFDMKITVPAKLEVAGSGDLWSVRKHDGQETWTAAHGGPSTAEQFQQAYNDPDTNWSVPPIVTDPRDLFDPISTFAAP